MNETWTFRCVAVTVSGWERVVVVMPAAGITSGAMKMLSIARCARFECCVFTVDDGLHPDELVFNRCKAGQITRPVEPGDVIAQLPSNPN